MRTAREVAHAATGCGYPAIGYGLRAGHSPPCDGATAAIEARDAEHAAERDRLLEAVRVARTALDKAHACPTVRNDGTCDGCHVQDALTLLTPTGAAPTDGGAK